MNTTGISAPSTQRLIDPLPLWLRGRRGLIIAGAAVTVAALALGWPWLAAAGLAPLGLSLLPCAAMCLAGLCMASRAGQSPACNGDGASTPAAAEARQQP